MKMTLVEYRDRLIEEGIKSVKSNIRLEMYKREAAIEGFERCRHLLEISDYNDAIRNRETLEREVRRKYYVERLHGLDENYWKHRWTTLQIEWMRDCMLVAYAYSCRIAPQPLSARAIIQYGRIVTAYVNNVG